MYAQDDDSRKFNEVAMRVESVSGNDDRLRRIFFSPWLEILVSSATKDWPQNALRRDEMLAQLLLGSSKLELIPGLSYLVYLLIYLSNLL